MATSDPGRGDDRGAQPPRDLGAPPRDGGAPRPTDRGTPWDERPDPPTGPDGVTTTTPGAPEPSERPARFAGARRRALLWNAGYAAVAGAVLLLLWGTGRPVDMLPDSVTLVGGIVALVWTGILVGIASGGVGRTPTALVGVVNVVVGLVGFAFGWMNDDVTVLVLVFAAQVAGFGVVQWTTTIRR